MKQVTLSLFKALVLLLVGSVQVVAATPRVLSITEVPETTESNYYQNAASYIYQLDYWFSPADLLGPLCKVDQVNWFNTDKTFAELNNYDTVIIWDAPTTITDTRDHDPWYSDMNVISPAVAGKIVEFVADGGTLIMGGGITCYGNGDPRYVGATANRGGSRAFFGYHDSPLADILPVVIPDAVTLSPFADQNKNRLTLNTPVAEPLMKNLNFGKWGFDAYHKVAAKPDGEVLLAASNGDPLIVRSHLGKGKIICITIAPKANNFVHNQVNNAPSNPLWPQEALLLYRSICWGMNKSWDHADEKKLLVNYESITAAPASLPLTVREQEFPYVAHALNPTIPSNLYDMTFKYYNTLGFNQIVMQTTKLDSPTLDKFLDGYHQGLVNNSLVSYLHPDLCSEARHHNHPTESYAQLCQPGGQFAQHYGAPFPCPYSPVTVKEAVKQVHRFMPVAKNYSNIRGCFYDDEWAWVMGYRNPYEPPQGIGSYSPWVNERFKRLTGMDAPLPTYRKPGYVAPEDDPWLIWCQTIRQDGYLEYNEKVKQAFREYKEDFRLSNYPGGFEGNLDVMIEEVYLDCWKQSPLLTFERADVRCNFRQDALRNQSNIWALMGIFRMPEDKSIYPETLRLTTGAVLGSGFKGLILWNSTNLWAPYLQIYGRDHLFLEAQRIGEHLRRFGPMYTQLVKEPSDLWILSGWFWVNSFDNYYHLPPEGMDSHPDKERSWWQWGIADVAGPAAFRAGMYPEFVTEKQLMGNELFYKKAVFLPGMLYARQAVVDNLAQFIKQGGTVFVDESTQVDIPGAVVLPADLSKWHDDIAAGMRPIITPTEKTYRKQIGHKNQYVDDAIKLFKKHIVPVVQPRVRIDSSIGAHAMLRNGSTVYLFVYNTDVDNPQKFHVSFENLPENIYDLSAGEKRLQVPLIRDNEFDVELPAGGWKVFALAPNTIDMLQAGADLDGKDLTISLELFDDDKNTFAAAVPVQITVTDQQGKSFDLYRATSLGRLNTTIACRGDIPQPDQVTIKELFSGKSVTITAQ